jgi:hypothetical protein
MVFDSAAGTILVTPWTARRLDGVRHRGWLRAVAGGLMAASGALFGVTWQELTHDH